MSNGFFFEFIVIEECSKESNRIRIIEFIVLREYRIDTFVEDRLRLPRIRPDFAQFN